MDIAKYMVTALLLSTIFADMAEPIILWMVIFSSMIVLGIGLYWVNESDKELKKKNKKNEYDNCFCFNYADCYYRYYYIKNARSPLGR